MDSEKQIENIQAEKSCLYVVGTPIGNLADMTVRALEILKKVDAVACENSKRHLKLLNHFGIKKRLLEYSPSNEENSANGIISLLKEGKSIALVSDAGMPLISDPGKKLVRKAVENGFRVIPIPGVSAMTTLASVSFFSKRLAFLGFMPKTPGKIRKELRRVADFEGTVILFVSQYDIKKVMQEIYNIFGNVEIIIGREMTKINEEYIFTRAENILNDLKELITEKGEFSVAITNVKEK